MRFAPSNAVSLGTPAFATVGDCDLYRSAIIIVSCVGYEFGTSMIEGCVTIDCPSSPFSPAVMLSPKARKRVALITGTGSSVTEKVQLAERIPSVASHVTGVVPTVNVESDPGVHVVLIGGAPPVAVTSG